MPPRKTAAKKSTAKAPVVTAYDFRTRESAPMKVTHIYKKPILDKEGSSTGKFRFRFAGTSQDGQQKMSVFTSEDKATAYSKASGVKITSQQGTIPAERKQRQRLSCKVIEKKHVACQKRKAKRALKKK